MKQRLIPFKLNGQVQSNFYVDPRSHILYFKKGHAGEKIKFSTGCPEDEFVKAKRFANKEFNRRIGKEVAPRSLIRDELDAWLVVKESEGLKYDTLNNVRRAKLQIEEFWGSLLPSDIGKDSVAAWIGWWARSHADIDMENAIKYMRNFSRYLAQKVVDGRPLLPVVPDIKDPNYKKIRRRRKKKKENIFTALEFKRVIETAKNPRDQLLILIMYTMATRVTETLEMRFGKEIVRVDGEWIYRWRDGQNKADHDGWHALHPALIQSALKRLENVGMGGRLFPQKGDQEKAMREQMIDWPSWRKRANLTWHWTPHTFRHTCLSNLFNDPANPQALICKLYRVSLATAMETYIHPTSEGRARMAKAIKVEL